MGEKYTNNPEFDKIKKFTPQEFAALVRKKAKAYHDVPDMLLVQKVLEKYPVYKQNIDWGTGNTEQVDINIEDDLI